jgi:hypothetical protein
MPLPEPAPNHDRKFALYLASIGGIVAGLCCLTPIVLVMFGLATVSFAASLGNVLYGDYNWHFRAAALMLVAGAFVVYLRRQGICSLDQARRQRTRILNLAVLVLLAGTAIYLIWTYVILHYWGIFAGLPWAQYSDEAWAIPLAAVLFAAVALLLWGRRWFRRRDPAGPQAVLPGGRSS